MVALLREVTAAAFEKGIQWFVGGASASLRRTIRRP